MWHIDQNGAYSIVKKDCDPDELLVRARVYDDLKKLSEKLNIEETAISETPRADYLYRMTVKASALAEYLANMVLSIDYQKFNTSLPYETQIDQKRVLVYTDVCSTLRRLQY